MKKIYSSKHDVIEKSSLYLELPENLLVKMDLFLSNTNLDKKDQETLIKLFEEVYSQGYENCVTD